MADNHEEYFVEADGSHNNEKKADGTWKWGFAPESKENQFKVGDKPLGGRPKGSKNKKTLRQELADKGGLSPAELLYSVMNDENANIGQRMKAAEKLLDFTEAKLSSIEVHTDENHAAPFNIFLNTTPEEQTVKDTCPECEEHMDDCECEGEE